MMKHFVLWGMDVENTWRTHPWISNSLLGMRCMTLPKKLPRWWFFQFHMFWQLFASDSDMFNVFDGLFRGNRWFVSFPHQKIVSTKSGYRANAHLLHDFDTIADHGTSILVHAALHVPNQQISEANLTKATKKQKKHHTRFNQAKYTLLASSSLIALELIAVVFGTSRCSRWRGDLVWSQWNQHGSPPAAKGESMNKSTICYLVLVNSSQS